MTTHPREIELALFAGGDCGTLSRFRVARHLRACKQCLDRVVGFRGVREQAVNLPQPVVNWNALAAEMRANIHLGLEAGECIRTVAPPRRAFVRMAAAFASLVIIAAAGLLMHTSALPQVAPVLEATRAGLEVRSREGSMTLLNRHGAVTDQAVSAQGAIRARYIDGEAGTVTINNVYLE